MQKLKIASLLAFLLFQISFKVNAQSEKEMVMNYILQQNRHEHKVNFGFEKMSKWNPVYYVAGSFMFVYQKLISPQFSASCLYEPSCSAYSKMLVSEYGLIRGTIFSADRLMRCNRMGGYDIEAHQINPKTGKVPESVIIYSKNIKEKLQTPN